MFDVASFVLTDEARKIGDYFAGTYVIDERADRDGRVTDMYEMEELKMLERRLRHLEAEINQKN